MLCLKVLLKNLVLFQLLVPDGDNLGVEGHLVHVLHVVVFFVQLLLSLGKETISALVLLNFDFCGWEFMGTIAVHLHHLGFASLGLGLLLMHLLLLNALMLSGILV